MVRTLTLRLMTILSYPQRLTLTLRLVGGMLDGTETGITVSYVDGAGSGDGTISFGLLTDADGIVYRRYKLEVV